MNSEILQNCQNLRQQLFTHSYVQSHPLARPQYRQIQKNMCCTMPQKKQALRMSAQPSQNNFRFEADNIQKEKTNGVLNQNQGSIDKVDMISRTLFNNRLRQRLIQENDEKINVLQRSSFNFDQIQRETQPFEDFLGAKSNFNINQNSSEKVQDFINYFSGKQYQENLFQTLKLKVNKQQKSNEQEENDFMIIKGDDNNDFVKMDNFMDKSLNFQVEQVQSSIKEFYDDLIDQKKYKNLKQKLMGIFIGLSILGTNPSNAFADSEKVLPTGSVSYSTFIEGVKEHLIERVKLFGDNKYAEFLNSQGEGGFVALYPDPDFYKILKENNVDVSIMTQDPLELQKNFGIIAQIILPILIFGGIAILFSRMNQGPGNNMMNNAMNIGKSKAKVQMVPDTGVKFDQVAGVDEAKQELAEIVDFLKNPEQYTQLGAKIPRGALLIGPPGTGKTMLAKAVAGEAGVPFISISAAEFIEMFVGVGASRVRDLFKTAKDAAPCIIFIDELDAVGRQRAQGIGMGNDEREQTINQLLTEMDGFEGNKGVIVLAATNIPEVLDKALLRPGRFDRQISVGLPDFQGRTQILEVHARDKKLSPDVNLKDIAKRCLGMSGADLQNVLNESAILTARRKKQATDMEDIYDSIDRIQIGLEKKGASFSQDRMKLVAYHEAGHALIGALMQEYDLVNKISIVPRGGTGGVTIFTPNEEVMESGMYSKEYLENRICVGLGGRIAEEIINGPSKITTGASNDFIQCTQTAKMMVEQMGMSDSIGPRNIAGSQQMMQQNSEGIEIRNKVDDEIDKILKEQYERGMKILNENKSILDAIAKTLIEKEKITGLEMLELIKQMRPDLISSQAVDAVQKLLKSEPKGNAQVFAK